MNLSAEERDALMCARLWEPWGGNAPGPPGECRDKQLGSLVLLGILASREGLLGPTPEG